MRETDIKANMRVLFISPVLEYPPHGGPWLRVYATIRALSSIGSLSIFSFCSYEAIGGEAARHHMLTLADDLYFAKSASYVPNSSWQRIRRGLNRLACRWSDILEIARISKSGLYDIIWLEYGNISYDLLILKLLTRCPVILDTDSVWSRFVLREMKFKIGRQRIPIFVAGFWKRIQEILGTNFADLTIAASDVDAIYYRRISFSKHKVRPLYNVIDLNSYTEPIEPPVDFIRPAICMTGSMSSSANVDAAIWLLDMVMPFLWKKHPSLRVYIIGKKPPTSLQSRSSDQVIVTGEVESSVAYIRNADVVVVPLRWESGTRFKILEAFACETPVVSTRLGAEGLPVENGKHLLLADTPEEFSDAISNLLSSSANRKKLTENGLALVKSDYSIGKAENQVREILATLNLVNSNSERNTNSS